MANNGTKVKNGKTEVAPPKPTEVSVLGDLDLAELQRDAGIGVTGMTAADVALPYISILQALSPQVQPGRPEYIEGAQASMFFNTVSLEVMEGREAGIMFIPCAYDRRYVRWHDRDAGGGYVTDYPVTTEGDNIRNHVRPDERGKLRFADGDVLVETAYHYGFYLDEGTWTQCVIPLKSTGLKVNRRWNNELMTTTIPGTDKLAARWLYIYKLTTFMESKKNLSWWSLKATKTDLINKSLYQMAKTFNTLVEAGDVTRMAPPSTMSPTGGGEAGDDVPF